MNRFSHGFTEIITADELVSAVQRTGYDRHPPTEEGGDPVNINKGIESLVPRINQWLLDHGAVFVTYPSDRGMLAPSVRHAESLPPDQQETASAESRYLFIGTDDGCLQCVAGPACRCRPDQWQQGLEWAIQGADRVWIRSVKYLQPDDVDGKQPAYIRVRLLVIPKQAVRA